MPTTRKKVNKTIYKDENSEEDGDFSDSGSEAKISEGSSSEDEVIESENSSADEFHNASRNRASARKCPTKKPKFTKSLVKKINKQLLDEEEIAPTPFSVKDLTETDKLLPPILNLSESDSSDDESPKTTSKNSYTSMQFTEQNEDSSLDVKTEYKDVWSNNMQVQDNSEEIARQTYKELEQHILNIEETKVALQNYTLNVREHNSDVKDLLAMGEDIPTHTVKTVINKPKFKKRKDDSDSEIEDWEEVKETKQIPQQGIQLFVEFPEANCRKSKKIDVEMMMKRKINRVKKEYQIYMHKVHVLCWLGHGNYISGILNDQELMTAALSLVPSKECYPGERVNMKYVEQLTTWYKDKLILKRDKNEDKFKPKAPPLKNILLDLIKRRVVTTNKYLVFIFVAMVRALGLQCRVLFNFITLPIKPPVSELCSLSIKQKDKDSNSEKAKSNISEVTKTNNSNIKKSNIKKDIAPKVSTTKAKVKKQEIAQLDGNCDSSSSEDEKMQMYRYDKEVLYDYENIMQVDGNDDSVNTRKTRSAKRPKADTAVKLAEEVSPPKIPKKNVAYSSPKRESKPDTNKSKETGAQKTRNGKKTMATKQSSDGSENCFKDNNFKESLRNSKRGQKAQLASNYANEVQQVSKTIDTGNTKTNNNKVKKNHTKVKSNNVNLLEIPSICITDENKKEVSSEFFENAQPTSKSSRLSRKRSHTTDTVTTKNISKVEEKEANVKAKGRTKSAPGTKVEKSKYFDYNDTIASKANVDNISEDKHRVSHKDLAKNTCKKANNDVTKDIIDIMKNRMKDAKLEAKKGLVKGKLKQESDEDSDYLPVEDSKKRRNSEDDFKPTKISPRPSTSRKIDRRVLSSSSNEETNNKNNIDVWCEIYVEELEQWITVDVVKGKIHCISELYRNATHPVCYVVAWDNNNYLKDLTRKYVPHYNTVTRKLRAELSWWNKAVQPYLGPKTAQDKEEDEYLDRMQLEAPLPKSVAEYKNHPLYALKRHLLKFEAIYPPDAAVLGFVRNEPVYARECVYVCRSRDTWLKEAKVVRLGEQPYKVVKARPKWDKLSNKLITDKPLEVFGPWQVQDYEPPVAENGIVPRNAYGNVELFKDCMLPKGTVHIKLPGLNRVAKKLNIDCAPAMTGFEFNGGWSHPVYDGFVVCQEFQEIVTEAWVKDQEEQERKEREKTELRVYGNWKRLIKGLLIRERLKNKYGFEKPTTSGTSKGKVKGPRLVLKKKS